MSKSFLSRSDQVSGIQSAPYGGGGGAVGTTEVCSVVQRER